MLRSRPVAEFRLRGELATAGSRSDPPGAGPAGDRSLLDAVALIDRQLLVGGAEQEQVIEKQSFSEPTAGSVAAGGDAPLQKADVIAYDTSLLRQESETVYANPRSSAAALLNQRCRYAHQLTLLRG